MTNSEHQSHNVTDKITYKQSIPYYNGMPCFVGDGDVCCLKMNSLPGIDEDGFLSAYYWRDGGLWGCFVSEIYPNVFAFTDESLSNLYLNEVIPITLEEWKNSNGNYCPNVSNVFEALSKDGYGGHKGINIE